MNLHGNLCSSVELETKVRILKNLLYPMCLCGEKKVSQYSILPIYKKVQEKTTFGGLLATIAIRYGFRTGILAEWPLKD